MSSSLLSGIPAQCPRDAPVGDDQGGAMMKKDLYELDVRRDPANMLPLHRTLAVPSPVHSVSEGIEEEEDHQECTCSILHHSTEVWNPSVVPSAEVPICFLQKGPSIEYEVCFPCFDDGVGVLYRLVSYSFLPSSQEGKPLNSPPTTTEAPPHSVPMEGGNATASARLNNETLNREGSAGEGRSYMTSFMSTSEVGVVASQRWAFYNDTRDTLVRVVAKFGAGSQLTALGTTRLTIVPEKRRHAGSQPQGKSGHELLRAGGTGAAAAAAAVLGNTASETARGGGVKGCIGSGSALAGAASHELLPHSNPLPERDPKWMFQATLDILPCETELFIEGLITSFSLDIHTEALPAESVVFKNGTPAVTYHKVYPCFKNTGNGLLFRLVNIVEEVWYFYNDTKEYNMKVVVDFAMPIEVEPLGDTVLLTREEQTASGLSSSPLLGADRVQTPTLSSDFITGLSTPRSSCTTAMGPGVGGFSLATTQPLGDPSTSTSVSPSSLSSPSQEPPARSGPGEEMDHLQPGLSGWSLVAHDEFIPSFHGYGAPFSSMTMTTMVPVSQYPNGCSLQLSIPPGVTAAFIRGNPSVYKLEVVADICVPLPRPASPEEKVMPVEPQNAASPAGVHGHHHEKEDAILMPLDTNLPGCASPQSPPLARSLAHELPMEQVSPSFPTPHDAGALVAGGGGGGRGGREEEGGHLLASELHTSNLMHPYEIRMEGKDGLVEGSFPAPLPPAALAREHFHPPPLGRSPPEVPRVPPSELPYASHEGIGMNNNNNQVTEAHSIGTPHPTPLLTHPAVHTPEVSPRVFFETALVPPPRPPLYPPPFLHGVPDPAIIPHISAIIPCFQDHGDGVLFRLVDDELDIWAFYNDTMHLVITAIVQIPLAVSENVKLAPGVMMEHRAIMRSPVPRSSLGGAGGEEISSLPLSSASAPVVEEVLITSVQIRPLATAPFLVNAPRVFETFFSVMTLEEESHMRAERQ